MSFKHDYSRVKESGGFSPVPKGDYHLKIIEVREGTTKNGDPNANIKLSIEGYVGKNVWHNISFLPANSPGAGISKHWLHSIGQPFEGDDVDVEPQDWIGIVIFVSLDIEEYQNKNDETKQKNVIKKVISVREETNRSEQEEEETSF